MLCEGCVCMDCVYLDCGPGCCVEVALRYIFRNGITGITCIFMKKQSENKEKEKR